MNFTRWAAAFISFGEMTISNLFQGAGKVESYQRKYLKGLAHRLKPVVLIGQGGLSAAVVGAIDAALNDHELIKIKFNDVREKEQKAEITAAIEKRTKAAWVGSIGHTAIFYRPSPDAEKRRIELPLK